MLPSNREEQMSKKSIAEIAKEMAGIDIAILSTHTENGEIANRPMSNNGDVEYGGDSFFFTDEHTHTVRDIERDPKVGLSFTGAKGFLGKPPNFIVIEGMAELIRDKAVFEKHWTKDLEIWFKDGVDTPGIVLIKVHASRIHYWDGADQGEIKL